MQKAGSRRLRLIALLSGVLQVSQVPEMDEDKAVDVANCYRICRNFQDYGAKTVMRKLKEWFAHKTDEELCELIVEVEKITSQSSKPAGC